MSVISAGERKHLASRVFAGPHRSYPITDAEHARKAIQLSPRGVAAGHITEDQRAHIVRVARAFLARGGR